jgi:hypothetical protein
LLFVYIRGWQNNAISGDVCRFEHFIDTMSRFPEMTARKINVIGVYIAWRGRDLTPEHQDAEKSFRKHDRE